MNLLDQVYDAFEGLHARLHACTLLRATRRALNTLVSCINTRARAFAGAAERGEKQGDPERRRQSLRWQQRPLGWLHCTHAHA